MVKDCTLCEECTKLSKPMTWKENGEGIFIAMSLLGIGMIVAAAVGPIAQRTHFSFGGVVLNVITTAAAIAALLGLMGLISLLIQFLQLNRLGHRERVISTPEGLHCHRVPTHDSFGDQHSIAYNVGGKQWGIICTSQGQINPDWKVSHAWAGSNDVQIKDKEGRTLGPKLPIEQLFYVVNTFSSVEETLKAGPALDIVRRDLEEARGYYDSSEGFIDFLATELESYITLLESMKGTANSRIGGAMEAFLRHREESLFGASILRRTKAKADADQHLEKFLATLPEGLQERIQKLRKPKEESTAVQS